MEEKIYTGAISVKGLTNLRTLRHVVLACVDGTSKSMTTVQYQ